MLAYGVLATLGLAGLGVTGVATGVLLWPAVGLHLILTALLARDALRMRRDQRR
jgi:hypothetical protein